MLYFSDVTISGCSPTDIIVDDATKTATWTTPDATSLTTEIPAPAFTPSVDYAFPIGDTTVTYTWSDASNIYGKCSFTVTVQEQTGKHINRCYYNNNMQLLFTCLVSKLEGNCNVSVHSHLLMQHVLV